MSELRLTMGLSARINLEMMHSIIMGYLATNKCNNDAKSAKKGGIQLEIASGLDERHIQPCGFPVFPAARGMWDVRWRDNRCPFSDSETEY